MTVRVLVADDHTALRMGMAAIVQSVPEFELAGEAVDGLDAIAQYERLRPDVMTLDLRMPGMDGLQVVERILGEHPAARILVMTVFDHEEDVARSVRSGAMGYILKAAPRDQIVEAIARVARGERWFPDFVAVRLATRLRADHLTPREQQVLELLRVGISNKEIARRLGLTESTVKSHVKEVLNKLGALSRTEAVTIALRRGLLK